MIERSSAELAITRVFDAPCEVVFRMWTDVNYARHWCGPRDYPAVHMEMDAQILRGEMQQGGGPSG
ncbi:MAG: hypothetical protein ACLP1D_29530 [Xanthobacteraceae bacterium]|jgi:uncharacterized protein YndB with AHSA1/START domain